MLFTIVFNEYGLTLDTTDMEAAFHACDMPQLVQAVINAETGKILWGSLEHHVKFAETKKKVGGITRASVTVRGVKQYDDAIIIPMAKEWVVLDRACIGDHYHVMEFKNNAINMFEQKTERKWCNRPFYDEVRLYHNGMLVRLSVNGHEFIF